MPGHVGKPEIPSLEAIRESGMVDSHEMQRRGPWQWRHDASKIGSTSKAKSGGWAWTGGTPRPINGARMSQPNLADTLVERETGIEPATNGLGSRDSTTELLPRGIEHSIVTETEKAPGVTWRVRAPELRSGLHLASRS